MTDTQDKLDIVLLAGTGRSGSTLIERILETYDGVASAGEFGLTWWYVLRVGIKFEDFPCSCGERLGDCGYWNRIFERTGFTEAELDEIIRLQASLFRPRFFLRYFVPGLNRDIRERIRKLATYHERYYRAVAAETGASVIIDASNIPMTALVIKEIPNANAHVLHWVRRPEGVVNSWNTVKQHPGFGGAPSDTKPPAVTAIRWLVTNTMVELLRLVMPVRRYHYEWFVQSPRERIVKMMSEIPDFASRGNTAFEGDYGLSFTPGHAYLGNPDRFRSGKSQIRRDDRYRKALNRAQRLLVVTLTWPLYLVYGYFRGRNRA